MAFKGGNKAVRDHAVNGKDLLVFEALGKGQGYRFPRGILLHVLGVSESPGRQGSSAASHRFPSHTAERWGRFKWP